jgi:hypothetical protein
MTCISFASPRLVAKTFERACCIKSTDCAALCTIFPDPSITVAVIEAFKASSVQVLPVSEQSASDTQNTSGGAEHLPLAFLYSPDELLMIGWIRASFTPTSAARCPVSPALSWGIINICWLLVPNSAFQLAQAIPAWRDSPSSAE